MGYLFFVGFAVIGLAIVTVAFSVLCGTDNKSKMSEETRRRIWDSRKSFKKRYKDE